MFTDIDLTERTGSKFRFNLIVATHDTARHVELTEDFIVGHDSFGIIRIVGRLRLSPFRLDCGRRSRRRDEINAHKTQIIEKRDSMSVMDDRGRHITLSLAWALFEIFYKTSCVL